MNPVFSLCHPTARLPNGWILAWRDWMAKCDYPEKVEYVLVVHESDYPSLGDIPSPNIRVAICGTRRSWVESANLAARVSNGRVLVSIADDFFPCDPWDTEITNAIPDLNGQYVLDVNTGHNRDIIICPIFTRAYYERPGRGGHPNGEFLYPEYISMGADDDFTHVAFQDGVVVNGKHLHFDHRHPSRGLSEMDEVYQWTQRPEAWEVKDRVLARRKSCGFSK